MNQWIDLNMSQTCFIILSIRFVILIPETSQNCTKSKMHEGTKLHECTKLHEDNFAPSVNFAQE